MHRCFLTLTDIVPPDRGSEAFLGGDILYKVSTNIQ